MRPPRHWSRSRWFSPCFAPCSNITTRARITCPISTPSFARSGAAPGGLPDPVAAPAAVPGRASRRGARIAPGPARSPGRHPVLPEPRVVRGGCLTRRQRSRRRGSLRAVAPQPPVRRRRHHAQRFSQGGVLRIPDSRCRIPDARCLAARCIRNLESGIRNPSGGPVHPASTHESTRSRFPEATGTVTEDFVVSPGLCWAMNLGISRRQPSSSSSSQASGGRMDMPRSLR